MTQVPVLNGMVTYNHLVQGRCAAWHPEFMDKLRALMIEFAVERLDMYWEVTHLMLEDPTCRMWKEN